MLSVTVAADKCVDADGYATAFMVMGMEHTKKFLNANPELHLEVYLIASSGKEEHEVWMNKGFQSLIVE